MPHTSDCWQSVNRHGAEEPAVMPSGIEHAHVVQRCGFHRICRVELYFRKFTAEKGEPHYKCRVFNASARTDQAHSDWGWGGGVRAAATAGAFVMGGAGQQVRGAHKVRERSSALSCNFQRKQEAILATHGARLLRDNTEQQFSDSAQAKNLIWQIVL